MRLSYGSDTTEYGYGYGVSVELTGDEVASAIDAYLVAHSIHIRGARTITVNGELCEACEVYVDPSGFVVADGARFSGRGPTSSDADAPA